MSKTFHNFKMFGFIPKFGENNLPKAEQHNSEKLKQVLILFLKVTYDQCKWADVVIGTIFDQKNKKDFKGKWSDFYPSHTHICVWLSTVVRTFISNP